MHLVIVFLYSYINYTLFNPLAHGMLHFCPTKHMHVDMGNFLLSIRTIIDDQPVTGLRNTHFFSGGFCAGKQLSKDDFVGFYPSREQMGCVYSELLANAPGLRG